MCGICGIYAPRDGVDENLLRRMNTCQVHRGPDSEGYATFPGIGLGAERLKIIDLEGGDQPVSNEDGSVWVVYNGEIYNHLDLRTHLKSNGHRFRSRSDTEVLVHLYEERGEAFLDDLNGMFALALWDRRRGRLVLARDRLGIKPLYYCWDGRRLRFASEIKGILADEEMPRAVDPRALLDYLTFQNIFGDKTLYAGIRILEPGHVLLAQDEHVEVRPYWDMTFAEPNPGAGFAHQYGELLEDAVRMELVSDVPLGSHLSGGIDSSTIVALASRYAPGLATFSITFRGTEFDESEYSHAVAEHTQTDHYEEEVGPDSFPEIFPKILWHLDEPRVGPSVFPQYLLAQLARKHVTVVLTGHGGDELFAGYPAHLTAALTDAARGGLHLSDLASSLPGRLREEGAKRVLGLPAYSLAQGDLRRYGHEAVFKPAELRRLMAGGLAPTAYDPRDFLEGVLSRCQATSALDRLLYLEIKTYLPSLLLVEDRMSMAHSLEDRVPILDHRMAEFSGRVPGTAKVRGFTLKSVPRQYAASQLPAQVVGHRKVGFALPLGDWFRHELRPYVEREVLDGELGRLGLDEEYVRRVVGLHLAGRRDRTDQVWSLLNLAVWYNQVFQKSGDT